MIKFVSIRTKIIFAIVFVILVLQTTTLYLQYKQTSHILFEGMETKSKTSISSFNSDIFERLKVLETFDERKNFLEIYSEIKGKNHFISLIEQINDLDEVLFVDRTGKIIGGNNIGSYVINYAKELVINKNISSIETLDSVIVFIPVEFENHYYGGYLFFYSNKLIIDERNELLLRSLMLIIIILIIGILSSLAVSFTIMRPVYELVKAAEKIKIGDIDSKISIDSNDEISILIDTFESMRNSIKKKQKKSGDYSKNLEKQVKERTAELELKNKELKKFNDLTLSRELKLVESKVKERTLELESKNDELERFNKVAVGRELKMIELKNEIEELKKQLRKKK